MSKRSKSKKEKKKRIGTKEGGLFSNIECGFVGHTGERIYTEYSEFYGKEVEVFIASRDPLRRHLTRATELTKYLGFNNNKVCCNFGVQDSDLYFGRLEWN
jgi:hypothetical protein